MKRVTVKPNVKSVSDREILQRLASAYHQYKNYQAGGHFDLAEQAYKAWQVYEDEARRRMAAGDPLLRGANG